MTAPDLSLSGKTAVVCGATSGWGYGAAFALAARGAAVVVNSRDPGRVAEVAAAVRARGGRCVGFPGGVQTAAGAGALVEAAVAEFGAVDVLLNSTGRTREAPLLEATEEDWRDVLDTQLTAVFHCTAAVARQMVAQGRGGRIITLGGGAAYRPKLGFSAHAASKGAVVAASATWALELAPHGITVNVVRGGVRSRGTAALEAELLDARRATSPGATARDVGLYEPAEAVGIVVWLASDAAARYTGLSFGIDGDTLSVWPPVDTIAWTRSGGWTAEAIATHIDAVADELPVPEVWQQ